ncbi:hypothetical protein [Propionibacterium sp.]|uniref:hypothetical protein n=1 Tax=Propionibacterium sp. TaxID=1977903 RepID=UPI0039E8C39C
MKTQQRWRKMAENQTQQTVSGYEEQPHVKDGWVPPCCRPAKKSKLKSALGKLTGKSKG